MGAVVIPHVSHNAARGARVARGETALVAGSSRSIVSAVEQDGTPAKVLECGTVPNELTSREAGGGMDDIERERRWLVTDYSIVEGHHPTIIRQAYPFVADGWCIRVRQSLSLGGSRQESSSAPEYMLAVKGPRIGATRIEHEWSVPGSVATELYKRSKFKVVKERFSIVVLGRLWDVDFFHHDNEGLVIAECEFTPDDSSIEVPAWCGREVTSDRKYDNERLAEHPFMLW